MYSLWLTAVSESVLRFGFPQIERVCMDNDGASAIAASKCGFDHRQAAFNALCMCAYIIYIWLLFHVYIYLFVCTYWESRKLTHILTHLKGTQFR